MADLDAIRADMRDGPVWPATARPAPMTARQILAAMEDAAQTAHNGGYGVGDWHANMPAARANRAIGWDQALAALRDIVGKEGAE